MGLVRQYGYVGLYFLFVVDTLGVFLPSKTMLMISGFLVAQGYLQHFPLFLATLSGSLTGFLTGYTIGVKVGKPFLDKYGRYMHLKPERLEQAEKWFAKYGSAAILVAYFLPGVRHIVPYLSGMAQMPFRKVMSFASLGATLWILTFTSIGRFMGDKWPVLKKMTGDVIGDYLLELVGILVVVIVAVVLFRRSVKSRIKED